MTERAHQRQKLDLENLELFGTERVLYDSITRRLNSRSTNDRPVVAVDFGGTFGISFIRIARKLDEEHKAVSQKRVLMVVTNLGMDIDRRLEANATANPDFKISEQHESFVRKYKDLVHFLVADARELVDAAQKQGIDLHGTVDVLHESEALTHGLINDIDLPKLAETMAKGGVFFLECDEGLVSRNKIIMQFDHARNIAHTRGLKTMQKMGMKKQRGERKSRYGVYIKS